MAKIDIECSKVHRGMIVITTHYLQVPIRHKLVYYRTTYIMLPFHYYVYI